MFESKDRSSNDGCQPTGACGCRYRVRFRTHHAGRWLLRETVLLSSVMDLSATVYFDFEDADSWRFFVLCATADAEGGRLDLDWIGLAADLPSDAGDLTPGQRALAAHASVREPERQKIVRQALFTMRHRQGDSFEDDVTFRAAAKVAGLDGDVLLKATTAVGLVTLRRQQKQAKGRDVIATPTLVAEGPPLRVGTNAAVLEGPARARIGIIAGMLADDGLWKLEKP